MIDNLASAMLTDLKGKKFIIRMSFYNHLQKKKKLVNLNVSYIFKKK